MQPPRRESSAGVTSQRPGMKTRAHSAPTVPKTDDEGNDDLDGADDDDKEGEEITDDAFFRRYHFSQPIEPTQEEPSDSSAESSSDTEGPLSPTHLKHRQSGGDVPSEPSTGVSIAFVPSLLLCLRANTYTSSLPTVSRHRPCRT